MKKYEETMQPVSSVDIKRMILYEDSAILVLNKPAGLVVHPAHAHPNGTLADAVAAYFPGTREAVYDPANPVSVSRAGIVHRLDKDTSGVLVIAKTPEALHFLTKELAAHRFHKRYIALVYGSINEPMTVNKPLGRGQKDRRLMAVQAEGKPAESYFIPAVALQYADQPLTLLVAEPVTGRTHQLRVHLKSISRPVLGDPLYTTKPATELSQELGLDRQALHAAELSFRHPITRDWQTFEAPLPDDFSQTIKKTRFIKKFQCDENVCKSMIFPFFKS